MDPSLNIPITAALLGGGMLVLQNALMLNVGMYRAGTKKGVGHDGDVQLERLVRRHGNLAENAAIFVAVLALLEIIQGQSTFIVWTAIVFAAARMLHVLGFSHSSGSHLIEATGGRRVFLLLRSMGATLSAVTGAVLGGYTVYTLLGLF